MQDTAVNNIFTGNVSTGQHTAKKNHVHTLTCKLYEYATPYISQFQSCVVAVLRHAQDIV